MSDLFETSFKLDETLELDLKDKGKDDVTRAIRKRAAKRQSITKTLSSIIYDQLDNSVDIHYLINKLKGLRDVVDDLDAEIEVYILQNKSSVDFFKHSDISEQYKDKVHDAINKLTLKLKDFQPVAMSNNQSRGTPFNLPPTQLPKFDGTPEKLESFLYQFEMIVNKFNITSHEKYTYLLQNVTGIAREIVESVPQGDLSLCYEMARDLLETAFSSRVSQQYSVIEKIINLKLNSSKHNHQWASKARVLTEEVRRLNIDGETFTQYFLWSGMNNDYKNAFMSVTNNNNPSLDEMIDNCYNAFGRMLKGSMETRTVNFSEVGNFRDNSEYKSINKVTARKTIECGLCMKLDDSSIKNHKLKDCPKYRTPEQKLDKIRQYNGCVKCGYLNHTVANCRYRFPGKCTKCHEYHAYFLCVAANKSVNRRNVSTNNVELLVMHSSRSSSVSVKEQIPTVTFPLPDKNNCIKDCRVMLDPASEGSFISEKCASELKHTVVNSNVELNITGFNETKLFSTRIIELSVNMHGDIRKFQAAVIPNLKPKMNGNYSKIAEAFAKENIPLADKYLGDNGPVDILLGVDFAHILPIQSCVFGIGNCRSIVYFSTLGIMLAGNLSRLEDNLIYLNKVKDFMAKYVPSK